MNRIYISLRDIPTTRLQLGFEGENDHTQVIFDGTLLYARYPSAVASMTVKSPSGGLYPKTLAQSGNKLVWNITASDCAKFGSGQYQLTFTSGTEVIKTYIGSFSVNASLLGSGDPPDPVDDWLQEAQEALDAFEQDVSDAEAWAVGTRDDDPVGSTDPAYHNNSKYYAEQAGAIEQTIETTGAAQVAAIEAKGEEVLESIPSDYTELSEDVDELYAIKAPVITESASGSIASFPDGADGMPLKNLSVAIEPVQDLHGQDSPYPAGGGANKFGGDRLLDDTLAEGASIDIEKISDTSMSISAYGGTNIRKLYDFDFKPDTRYTLIIRASNNFTGAFPFVFVFTDGTNQWMASNTNGLSVTTSAEGKSIDYIGIRQTGTITYLDQSETGLFEGVVTADQFQPYSNICPISGWTGAEVTRTGINIWDEEWELGRYDTATGASVMASDRIRCKNPIRVNANTEYRFVGTDCIVYWYDKFDNYISYATPSAGDTRTSPPGAYYARFNAYSAYGTTYNNDISINYPASDTSYHPYSGSTIEYEFPSSAGTVYGGTLTIHQDGSGELVVDRAEVDLGSLSWGYNSTLLLFNASYSGIKKPTTDSEVTKALSNVFKTYSVNGIQGADVANGIAIGKTGFFDGRIVIKDTDYTDGAVFKSALTSMGAKLVCEVAEATSYTLTNPQVIELLKGSNNIWADTGNVSLEYPADTKLYIDGKIAEIQALILENISNS